MVKSPVHGNRVRIGMGSVWASLALVMGCGDGRVVVDALARSERALPLAEESLCAISQALVGSYAPQSWDALPMTNTLQESEDSFVSSKPRIEGGKVVIQTFFPDPAGTSVPYRQVWCKMKTGKSIDKAKLGVSSTGDQKPCAAVHGYLLAQVVASAPAELRPGFEEAAKAIRFEADRKLSRGDEWVNADLKVDRAQTGEVLVQAPALLTAEWIPFVGGNHYCKLLSLQGLSALLEELALSQTTSPLLGNEYTVALSPGALYPQGALTTPTVQGDAVDLYVPLAASEPTSPRLVAAVFLQGGKVDKAHYGAFARLLSSYGFAVAVPAHNSLFGKNFIEQKVANQVWDYLKAQNQDPASALYDRLDPTRVVLLGHSLGGLAGLNILDDKCSPPTCLGSYKHPAELSALVIYATNTKNPLGSGYGEVNTRDVPVLFIQGDLDSKTKLPDTLITFRDKTQGHPKVLVTLRGANHYGIAEANNPAGADRDSTPPVLSQPVSNETIARWAGLFLRAHTCGDAPAHDYVYAALGDEQDPNVEVLTDVR